MDERANMQVYKGLGVSDGIAIGQAVCLETRVLDVYRFPLEAQNIEAEVERLNQAVRSTAEEMARTSSKVGEELGAELAGIFDAHALLLNDDLYLGRIIERIREEKVNAEWAVQKTADELGERFARIESEHLRERGEDLRDVTRYLLRSLQGIDHHELSEIEGDVVIVADELTPSEAMRLGREGVMGFAIETGGRTSHTTIVARAYNLPAVTGLGGIAHMVADQDPVIVDGRNGTVILHPSPEVLEEYRDLKRRLGRRERELLSTRELAAVSLDGVEIDLMANVELPQETRDARDFGAMGIGLYRSEFLYLERSPELPSEEDHFDLYRRLLQEMAPHPVIIRTLDLGGRKLAGEILETEEENPVLGLRGIRLTLGRPEVFRTQLRALFRAAVEGEMWVMIPLVTTLEEVRRFRGVCEGVWAELEAEGTPFRRDVRLGAMIEVPAVAMTADFLAREMDFLSIGTNDLIQYALAVDRNNEHVTDLYQPLHPAVLRMIDFVVRSGRREGVDVSICGEMAGDPRLTPLLVGLGLRRLSMGARSIPRVKAQLRELSVRDIEPDVRRCLDLPTSDEVERFLVSRNLWLPESEDDVP